MSNKLLQQQLKPILLSLNSENLLSLLTSFKKNASSRVYTGVRLVGFQCYEVRIQYKESVTLGNIYLNQDMGEMKKKRKAIV